MARCLDCFGYGYFGEVAQAPSTSSPFSPSQLIGIIMPGVDAPVWRDTRRVTTVAPGSPMSIAELNAAGLYKPSSELQISAGGFTFGPKPTNGGGAAPPPSGKVQVNCPSGGTAYMDPRCTTANVQGAIAQGLCTECGSQPSPTDQALTQACKSVGGIMVLDSLGKMYCKMPKAKNKAENKAEKMPSWALPAALIVGAILLTKLL